MKKTFTLILCSTSFLLIHLFVFAQDSTKHSAAKQINKTSEQSDKLTGKKIQQQSLSGNRFIKPDTTATVNKTKKKPVVKRKRKHS